MSLADLNWRLFLPLCLALVGTRWLFRRVLPLRLISVSTAAMAGMVVFLGLGTLGYSEALWIPADRFAFFVWLAFLSYLVGAGLISASWKVSQPPEPWPRPSSRLLRWALWLCTVYVVVELILFLRGGGLGLLREVVLGGRAHFDALARIGEIADKGLEGSLAVPAKYFASLLFVGFWVVAFSGAPRRAMLIYVGHLVSILGAYVGRSFFLGAIAIPYLAYLVFYPPKKRWLTMQLIAGTGIILVVFSWNASVRIGQTYDLRSERVVYDTWRDVGNSVVPASLVLSDQVRGNWRDYVLSMATFFIPRAVWPSKPALMYNYEITYMYTGKSIGQGTSVVTSTMLGEAWYYFGWSGTIWLMLLFGITSQFAERFLTRHPLTLGMYFLVLYNSFIMVRSTFLTYYQQAVAAILAGLVLTWLVRFMAGKRPWYRISGPAAASDGARRVGS